MPVYRDEKTNTFMVQFKEKDLKGKFRCVTRRGFKTRREAVAFENEYKAIKSGSVRTSFEKFVREIYIPQMQPRLKPGTWATKMNMLEKHILPYFGFKRINEIDTNDVMRWQNEMLRSKNPQNGKPYAKTYLQSVNNQLTAVFSFAVKYYKLPSNPAHIVGNMGNEDEVNITYWALDQYKKFAEIMMDDPLYYYIFQVLFWTGIREGECLALQLQDINLKKKTLTINKTYYRLKGQDIIGTPKTKQSYRTVTLSDSLAEEIGDYINMMYKPNPTDRLFPVSKSALTRKLKQGAKKAGLPECRVHSLRHAAASLLLENGYSIPSIAARLGHSPVNVGITYKYAHSAPTTQEEIAKALDKLAKGEKSDVSEE